MTLLQFSQRILLTSAALVFAAYANASSSVWKASKNGQSIYIGGTVHLLNNNDHPLPSEYFTAYQAADVLIFETDIDAMKSPEAQIKALTAFAAKPGQSARMTLDTKNFQQAEQFFTERGSSMLLFQNITASGLALTMVTMELQRLGYQTNLGVDETFNRLAKKQAKPVRSLESIDFQIKLLSELGLGQENELIQYTLKDIERLPKYMDKIKALWREGDTAGMEKEMLTEFKQQFPVIFQRFLTDRNNNWMKIIANYAQTPEIEFILVGGLHLVGKEGLLYQLKQQGFTVEQL